jgi:lipid-A-disaccharide synthase-like uncharacterized protein
LGWNSARHHSLLPTDISFADGKMCLGLSILTWVIWLIAGTVLLFYCIIRRDYLFMIVQSINILAIVTTIILAKRADAVCPYHSAKAAIH